MVARQGTPAFQGGFFFFCWRHLDSEYIFPWRCYLACLKQSRACWTLTPELGFDIVILMELEVIPPFLLMKVTEYMEPRSNTQTRCLPKIRLGVWDGLSWRKADRLANRPLETVLCRLSRAAPPAPVSRWRCRAFPTVLRRTTKVLLVHIFLWKEKTKNVVSGDWGMKMGQTHGWKIGCDIICFSVLCHLAASGVWEWVLAWLTSLTWLLCPLQGSGGGLLTSPQVGGKDSLSDQSWGQEGGAERSNCSFSEAASSAGHLRTLAASRRPPLTAPVSLWWWLVQRPSLS